MKLDWSDMLLMVFVGWVAGMTTAAMLVHGDCSLRSKDAHYIQVLQDRGVRICVSPDFEYWGWDNTNHVAYQIKRETLAKMAGGE